MSVIDIAEGTLPATSATVDEKIGDSINYFILLEAIFKEQEEQEEQGERSNGESAYADRLNEALRE